LHWFLRGSPIPYFQGIFPINISSFIKGVGLEALVHAPDLHQRWTTSDQARRVIVTL